VWGLIAPRGFESRSLRQLALFHAGSSPIASVYRPSNRPKLKVVKRRIFSEKAKRTKRIQAPLFSLPSYRLGYFAQTVQSPITPPAV
jgi:hypothetical protein